MKKTVVFLAASLAASVAAQAADLPTRTAPISVSFAATPFTWTGFYAGANAGYAWGQSRVVATPLPVGVFTNIPVTRWSYRPDGFTGGLQVGYNQQVSNFVFGVEADFNFGGIKGSLSDLGAGGRVASWKTDIDWFGTLRARIGFVPTERLMIYATGGVIMANLKHTTRVQLLLGGVPVPQVNYLGSESETRFGWTIGGGAEFAFTNNWSAKVEYLYYDLGKTTVIGSPQVANPPFQFSHRIENTGHIARIGLNYRF